MKSRPGQVSRAALGVVLTLAVGSCTGGGEVNSKRDALLPSSAYRMLASGQLYLLLGQPSSGNVWRVDISDRRDRRVTGNPQGYGVSWISGSSAGVVLADARSGVDELAELDGDRVVARPEGHTVTPAINDAGKVAFIQIPDVVNRVGEQTYRVAIAAADGKPARTIYGQSLPLAALAWGPYDELAVISAPGGAQPGITSELLVLSGDGEVRRRLHPGIGPISAPVWSRTAPAIAVNGYGGRSEIITPDGRERELPIGWTAGCWNPDGRHLLLLNGDRLALWSPARPDTVTTLGNLSTGPATGCAWVRP